VVFQGPTREDVDFCGRATTRHMTAIDLWLGRKCNGLGINNLELLGSALMIRWLWAQKIDLDRPWAGLPVAVPLKARALFDVAVDAIVENGEEILFLERQVSGWSYTG
jgi:hypothetical protein